MARTAASPFWSNRDRAESAVAALKARAELRMEEDEPLHDQITDLLAYLMHACRYELIRFDRCLERASNHFSAETADHND